MYIYLVQPNHFQAESVLCDSPFNMCIYSGRNVYCADGAEPGRVLEAEGPAGHPG